MTSETDTAELATELTIARLGNANTRTSADVVPVFLHPMHEAVAKLQAGSAAEQQDLTEAEHVPAVSVRKSLANPDYIISLIDGKPYKALKRHL